MEPDTEVLFGLRKREHPSEPLVKTRRWFPTLMKICLFKVARFIVQAINKEVDKESPWTKRRWISLKVFLHDHVPKFLLEDLHKSYIIDNDDFNEVRCQICSEILLRPYGEDSKLSNWKNDVKLILADWLLKPFDDEDRHFVESSRQIDLSVLVPFDVHVTSIRFSNKTLGLKTLAKCLRRLVGLKEVRFDYTQTGDGMEFKLLKKYCRLKKFELRRSREAKFRPKTVENFLAFLRSQSDCIEELNLLHGIIWFKTEEMTFARIWEVVTGLRELTFLQLNNEDLTLIDVAALPPCQNVKTLFVKIFFDWKFAQGFPFKKLFPMVENVCLGNEHDFQTVEDSSDSEPGEIFQNATYFDAPIFVNPFWLMTFMPMVRQLSLNCWRGCSDYFEVNLPHLTDLELALTEFDDGTGSLHFKHFKSLFGSFPNLINFHLQLERLEDFDEKNFIDFLPGVKEKITNLKKLKLEIEKHPKEMTGASVCAFLRNSNLEMFEDFGKFKFSHRDFAELKDLAEDKNLIILPAIKIADDDFDIESEMYLQPVSIYGVRYQASSDEPVLHRYPWFPTLKFLSAHRLAGAVARALSRAGSSKTQWTSSEWLSLKEYLQDNMLKDVCEDLFESHINTNLRLPTGRCYYCRRLHRQVLRTDVRRNLSNLFESDKILNKLVLDPALDPPFVRPDVFYNSNLGRLGETDMNITLLSLTSSSKDPELLDSILRKVIHLEEFSMTYDGANDASVFDLLSQHCSLRKFSIVSKRLGFQSKNCIESFINFLLSQTESIQELTELVSLSGPIGESDYPLQFFESIAQMRRLTVFHWSGSGFINLSRFEVISICVRVKTIVISMDNQKIEMCPFDRWFPELESIRLVLQAFNENIISLEKSQNLSKVSSVAVLSLCFEIDPEPTPLSSSLQLMTLFPNASEVSIKSFHISPPIKDRVAVQRLRNLELRSYNNPILFDNFKIVFESCPNLINCALIFSTVSGYDQEEFVRFLESAKPNYQKMKKLNIDLCSPPAGMTGAAICAILCHSNLVQFQTFAKIKFTAEENEELKRVAKCQKLTIVPAFKVGSS